MTEKGYSVADVAARLGTMSHSLCKWVKLYAPNIAQYQAQADESAEIRRLKKELQWVTEERNILKKSAMYFASQPD